MNLAQFAIEKKAITQFAVLILSIVGVLSYFQMGKLEDPSFAIKTAMVVTQYPGASPVQVEEEVTDVLETAIQKMESLHHVRSMSRRGLSVLWVDIKENYGSEDLPQIWDDLRKKVHDASAKLPPKAKAPSVQDDYGDVYGVFLAITSDGYSYAELKDYVDELKKELLLVKDVSRVELWGTQQECVYVDMSRSSMSDLGIAPGVVFNALEKQNLVVDPGSADLGRERVRFTVGGEFDSVEAVGNLVISGGGNSDRMVLMRDLAVVRKGYIEPASRIMRFNGAPALGLAISTVSGGNVVHMGEAVKTRLAELNALMPVGIETNVVALQSDNVQQSINEFMVNLLEAVGIVVALLLVFMGLRCGLLIGAGLVLSIVISFFIMKLAGIDIHRISLGALIIALGMLVDNAIVVTEGILIKIQLGMDRLEAAKQTVTETAWPLLGATLVAVLAFFPVYAAENNTGEYCRTLFYVVGISLMVSWVLAMTVTPLWSFRWLTVSKEAQGTDPYAGGIYQAYKRLLEWTLHHRLMTLGLMVVLLFLAIANFKYVEKSFFPKSRRPQVLVDYWLPEGSAITATSSDMARLEKTLLEHPAVEAVAAFVGSGPARFFLSLQPEFFNPAYGQLVLNINDPDKLNDVIAFTQKELDEHYPYAEPRVRLFPLGPATLFKVEARFRGPDSAVLHSLAEQAKEIMRSVPYAKEVRDNWRQPVKVLDVQYSQARGLRTGLTREDTAAALKRSFDGAVVGLYRENNELLPIILRPPQEERRRIEDITALDVFSMTSPSGVPLGQLASGIAPRWEEPIIRRYDHQRAIRAQAEPAGHTGETLRQAVRAEIEAIPLPTGYTMEWVGEYKSSRESQEYVLKGVPVAFLMMAFVVVALFNAFRQPLVIATILPLSLVGITAGLLLTRQPFGFLSLLGALSLTGMLIKNAVILIDQTDMEIRSGKKPYKAIVDSAVSRIRPVMMAAMSTVLGMTPLLLDKFWIAMSVTIIFGLTFATILTLVVVPILYSLYFRIKPE